MNIFDLLFPPKPTPTGYAGDSDYWLKTLPKHEVFAGGGAVVDWSRYAPKFRYQASTMMCTAFAGCNLASMLEKRETGEDVVFSPVDLFTRADGTLNGNSVQATIKTMQTGLLEEKDCPWVPPMNDWNLTTLNLMEAYAQARLENKGTASASFAVKQATYVNPDRESMRQALADSPLLAILNVGRGYFDNPAPAVTAGSAHAVVITNVAADGKIRIFDSLTQSVTFDGFHWLSANFPILYAFGVLDLPNDWQEKQKEAASKPDGFALGRYGKAYSFTSELNAEAALDLAKKKNPTCAAYIMAKWEVYRNAIAYAGYSVQDVLNNCTSLRRGNGELFNFNQLRPSK